MDKNLAALDGSSAERSLVAVAMLKVRYDQKRQDYLDYLRAYVAQVLPVIGERVGSEDIARRLREEFALAIPIQVVERSLKRLEKNRALQRQDGSLFVLKDVRDESFEDRRIAARRELTEVVRSFKEHCQLRFEQTIEDEQAFVALTGFIRKFAVDCLRAFVYSSPLPDVGSTGSTDLWAASFINDAANSQGWAWLRIKTLFESVLLANAFTSPDADLATSTFRDVTFYVDTPMVLSLLGFHGPHEKQKCDELFGLIRALNGSVMVFGHTIDETSAVLKFAETHLDDAHAANRVIRYLRESRRTKSDVALAAANVEDSLKSLKVRVRETPHYDARFQVDERALEGCLDEDIGHINPRALLHDINSIRSIYVLRAGISPVRLEQSKAIFVTPNTNLARAADSYSRRFDFTRDVSPVVTDYALANICWLKRPQEAKHLVTLELLAGTVAALKPDEREWSACLRECEKLRQEGRITEDQLVLVRETLESQDDYMTLTKGVGVEFSPVVAMELARRAEGRVSAPLLQRIDEVEAQVLEAERMRNQSELRLVVIAKAIAKFVVVMVLLVVLGGTYFALEAAFKGAPLRGYSWTVEGIVIVVPILLATLTFFGWSKKDISTGVADLVVRSLKRLMRLP